MKKVSCLKIVGSAVLLFLIISPLYSLKYYGEWPDEDKEDDWIAVSTFSNIVMINGIGYTDTQKQDIWKLMQTAINLNFKIIATLPVTFDTSTWLTDIEAFYDTVALYSTHCVLARLFDNPTASSLKGNLSDEEVAQRIAEFIELYRQEGAKRNIFIPTSIWYASRDEMERLGEIAVSSPDVIGIYSYFWPKTSVADEAQRSLYEATVKENIRYLKARAPSDKFFLLVGQSFSFNGVLPSPEQQQWYIDDVRNDPQVLFFLWHKWDHLTAHGPSTKYSSIHISSHIAFGDSLINIGVHNVSVTTGTPYTTIYWETNLPCDSGFVEYGSSTTYGSRADDVTPHLTSHTVTIPTSVGDVVYYKITSKKAKYREGPYSSWFSIGAGNLTGTIRDENGNPLPNIPVVVTPGDYSAVTNEEGIYTINDIPPGPHTVVARRGAYKIKKEVNIIHNRTQVVNFDFLLVLTNGDFEMGDLTGWIPLEGIDRNQDVRGVQFAVSPASGNYYLGIIVCRGYRRGKVFQKISASTGDVITAYCDVFTDAWDYDSPEITYPEDNWCRIGIDPTGGTYPYSPKIVWSEKGYGFRQWTKISVSTVAQANVVTIFLDLFQLKHHEWNKTGIDNVEVKISSPLPAPTLELPPDTTTLTRVPITFKWSEVAVEAPPATYELQIATTPTFEKIYNSTVTQSTTFTIDFLPNGQYWWRVHVLPPNYSYWSAARKFTVNLQDTTPPEPPSSVQDDGQYTYSTSQLHFKWQPARDPESGIKTYYLSVGTTPDGEDVIYRKEVGNVTEYTLTNLGLTAGTTYYAVVIAENNVGLRSRSQPTDGICVLSQPPAPAKTEFYTPAPNYFDMKKNNFIAIKYALAEPEKVTIKIYDLAGNLVNTLIDEDVNVPTQYTIKWYGDDKNGKAVPSGVYVVYMKAGKKVEKQKIIVVK